MSQIVPFSFENNSLRVVTGDNGEPLFVGKDLCEALGYANPTDAMNQHCKGVAKRYPLQTAGGKQEVRVLTEADMLRLIVSSNLPAAQRFEAWVFEEVLPTIRKTGGYTAKPAPQPAPPRAARAPDRLAEQTRALRLVPMAMRAALALGLDKGAAALHANHLVEDMTGANVLAMLGQGHPAPAPSRQPAAAVAVAVAAPPGNQRGKRELTAANAAHAQQLEAWERWCAARRQNPQAPDVELQGVSMQCILEAYHLADPADPGRKVFEIQHVRHCPHFAQVARQELAISRQHAYRLLYRFRAELVQGAQRLTAQRKEGAFIRSAP